MISLVMFFAEFVIAIVAAAFCCVGVCNAAPTQTAVVSLNLSCECKKVVSDILGEI